MVSLNTIENRDIISYSRHELISFIYRRDGDSGVNGINGDTGEWKGKKNKSCSVWRAGHMEWLQITLQFTHSHRSQMAIYHRTIIMNSKSSPLGHCHRLYTHTNIHTHAPSALLRWDEYNHQQHWMGFIKPTLELYRPLSVGSICSVCR